MRLPFTGPWLLAPMEGVTEPCYRDLVLACNPPSDALIEPSSELQLASELGGAFTEFVRVVHAAVPAEALTKHLGKRRFPQPVGLQLMGADLDALAHTARQAEEAGAPLVDLNFGCPAKGALRGCTGSDLLRDPARLEETVRACKQVVKTIPVTAKIRAGYDNADDVEVLARAAEAGGADLLTVHCRTRAEQYCDEVEWERIARAVQAVTIPVCGNGGVDTYADFERMRAETGCEYVMVGRAALGNPWIFSGREVTKATAATFLLDYADLLANSAFRAPKRVAGRLKQLLRHWTAAGLTEPDPSAWLSEQDPARLIERLQTIARDRSEAVTGD